MILISKNFKIIQNNETCPRKMKIILLNSIRSNKKLIRSSKKFWLWIKEASKHLSVIFRFLNLVTNSSISNENILAFKFIQIKMLNL